MKIFIQQLICLMKWTFKILAIQTFFASVLLANGSSAQVKSVKEILVDLDLKNVTFRESLDQVERFTDLSFSYDEKLFTKEQHRISYISSGETLEAFLIFMSKEYAVSFKQVNNTISVQPKMTKSKDRVEIIIQDTRINGRVLDENGEALPGATIVEQGTSNGTTTDIDGQFQLMCSNEAILIISFIGYQTQEIAVNNRTSITVEMVEDSEQLDEVVVVGYGSVKKSDLTGSVTSIDAKQMVKAAPTSVNSVLQGRVSGVQVTQASAAPGGGVNIRIRGTSSIFSGSEPLYVIDGFPVYNSNSAADPGGGVSDPSQTRTSPNALSMLNPNNIESIEILKDASATSIYGSRGANGVVLITTKRGNESGRHSVEFETYYGIQQLDNKLDLMNAQEYINLANEAHVNVGLPEYFDGSSPDRPTAAQAETTDWQDVVYRTAPMKNYNLIFTGGNRETQYMLSGNYFDQDGIMLESKFQRANVRLALDQKVNESFKIGTNINFSRRINQRAPTGAPEGPNIVEMALEEVPWIKPQNEDGTYNINPLRDVPTDNPLAVLKETTDETITNRLLANLYGEYEFIKDLKLRVQGGTDYSFAERQTYFNRGLQITNNIDGKAQINQAILNSYLLNSVLSYNKDISSEHSISALLGYEIQSHSRDSRRMASQNFSSDGRGTYSIGEGLDQIRVGSSKNQWQGVGYFSRINYNWKDQLLVTFNARMDGNSKFGAENKWGFFPSGAIAYRLSEVGFVKDLNIFDNLKVRTSYGATGNSEIGIYLSQGTWSIQSQEYSFDNVMVNAAYLNRLENPDLQWETTYQFDIGADFGFFKNRLTFIFDYYHKKTTDLLMPVSLPQTTGFSTATQNIGTLVNKGFEFSLGGVITDNIVRWNMNTNFSVFRSEPTDLGEDDIISVASFSRYGGRTLQEGRPAGLITGSYVVGVYSDETQAESGPSEVSMDNQPGDYIYVDIDGDGRITSNDATFIGNAQPDFVFGLTNDISYKNFNLNFLIQGTYGNEILCSYPGISTDGRSNSRKVIATQRWTESNPDGAIYARADLNEGGSDFVRSNLAVSDGSYIRLKSLTLSYTFNNLTKFLPSAQIYAVGQNLITITDYIGYNPDISSQGEVSFGEGYDTGGYPLAKAFLVGLKLSF